MVYNSYKNFVIETDHHHHHHHYPVAWDQDRDYVAENVRVIVRRI